MSIIAAAWLAASAFAANKGWKDALGEGGLGYAGKRSYVVDLDRAWSERTRRILGHSGELKARISIERAEDEKQAEEHIKQWKLRLLVPFAGDAAYPGMVTKKYAVAEELRPREVEAGEKGRKVYVAPATDRLTFGAGAEDLATRRAVIGFRYCPRTKTAAEIELFWPAKDFKEGAALGEEAKYNCR